MRRYFLPISLVVALILLLFGQGFMLLLIPSSYTQAYKMLQTGLVQILSLAVLAFILSSKEQGGKSNFRIPHLRF